MNKKDMAKDFGISERKIAAAIKSVESKTDKVLGVRSSCGVCYHSHEIDQILVELGRSDLIK